MYNTKKRQRFIYRRSKIRRSCVESNAIYLITGPMASGKSTIAELVASSLPKAVHLRGDIFRRMITSGRE